MCRIVGGISKNINEVIIDKMTDSLSHRGPDTRGVLILPNTKKLSYYKYTSPLKFFEYMASGVKKLKIKLVLHLRTSKSILGRRELIIY